MICGFSAFDLRRKVGVHIIDFAKNDPGVENVNLSMNGTNVRLDRSWAFRPLQVLETRGASPKTKLVFSRGKIEVEPGKPVDPNANVETVRSGNAGAGARCRGPAGRAIHSDRRRVMRGEIYVQTEP